MFCPFRAVCLERSSAVLAGSCPAGSPCPVLQVLFSSSVMYGNFVTIAQRRAIAKEAQEHKDRSDSWQTSCRSKEHSITAFDLDIVFLINLMGCSSVELVCTYFSKQDMLSNLLCKATCAQHLANFNLLLAWGGLPCLTQAEASRPCITCNSSLYLPLHACTHHIHTG